MLIFIIYFISSDFFIPILVHSFDELNCDLVSSGVLGTEFG